LSFLEKKRRKEEEKNIVGLIQDLFIAYITYYPIILGTKGKVVALLVSKLE
jgi:hypothetical protein